MAQRFLIASEGLGALLLELADAGHTLIGPVARDGAIVYDEIHGLHDLPAGWGDAQEAGRYRLQARGDGALFAYNSSPMAWKKFLHPPSLTLWRARRDGEGFQIGTEQEEAPRYAFIGVRACDLRAIAIQDRVLMDGPYPDPHYAARRRNVFILAVQCAQAGGTCFCASMDCGPRASAGFDLAVTELLHPEHCFLVEVGTEAGNRMLARIPHRVAGEAEWQAALQATEDARAQMGRRMDTRGIKALLYDNAEHPRWAQTAQRCLSCANCTMVCPTCFCTAIEDHTDLDGGEAWRVRQWDSCFNSQFSYIHGGIIRAGTAARYRQWLTHKLAAWQDQFGSSGCVGCGRCIAWCPEGIDITEEVAAIRAAQQNESGEDA